MTRTSRLCCALGVVMVGAAAAGPLSVHATDGDTDTVVFSLHVHTDVPVPLVGATPGGIPYHVAQVSCDIVSSDGEFLGCAIMETGAGNYANLACGTGVANGGITLTELADGGVDQINYAIELVGGVGAIIAPGVEGAVQLTPQNPNAQDCGQDFALTGTAVTG